MRLLVPGTLRSPAAPSEDSVLGIAPIESVSALLGR